MSTDNKIIGGFLTASVWIMPGYVMSEYTVVLYEAVALAEFGGWMHSCAVLFASLLL